MFRFLRDAQGATDIELGFLTLAIGAVGFFIVYSVTGVFADLADGVDAKLTNVRASIHASGN